MKDQSRQSLNFSAFSQDERKIGIDLEQRRRAYEKRRKALTATMEAAQTRLDTGAILAEVINRPELDESEKEKFGRVVEGYLDTQAESLDAAKEQIADLDHEWVKLDAMLREFGAVMHAVRIFEEEHGIAPVADPDLPEPDDLATGIYAYEDLVRADLETTRELLASQNTKLLTSYDFRSAEFKLDGGGGGELVVAAADLLLAVRTTLSNLRVAASLPDPAGG